MTLSPVVLKEKVREGFVTSAYRGATGRFDALPQDDTVSKQGLRFVELISPKLEPFPRTHTGPLQSQVFGVQTTNHKTHTYQDISYAKPTPVQAPSSTGVVPSGLRDSRGFLETTTSTQRQQGTFSDEVMAVYRKGQEAEASIERQRALLQTKHYVTAPPDPWRVSTMDHSNLSSVDEAAYRSEYRSRHNLVLDSVARQDEARQRLVAANAADMDSLSQHVRDVHAATLLRGYRAPSGKGWETTNQDHYCPFDGQGAEEANQRFSVKPMPQHDISSVALAARNVPAEATEMTTAYQPRRGEPSETKYRTSGALNVVNGTLLVSPKYHHPRSDVKTGTSYKPSEIVQGQYLPMSSTPLLCKQ